MRLRVTTILVMAGGLVGSAAGQPGAGTYASGLLHDPLGGVTSLAANGRKLRACCLGSTGKDGVEVHFRSAHGGGVSIEMGTFLARTGTLQAEWRDDAGQGMSLTTLQSGGDGSVTVTTDFTALGATAVHTIVYGSNGAIVSETTTGGPQTQDNVVVPNCPDGSPPVWWSFTRWNEAEGRWVTQWVYSCATGTNLNGDPYPGLRVITPILPVGTPVGGHAETLRVTGTDPNELVLDNAALGTFGASSWGAGSAHLDEVCAGPAPCVRADRVLAVSNLGSSGQDGVRIFEAGEVALGSALSVATLGPPLSGSETVVFLRRGDAGTPDTACVSRTLSTNPATGEVQISLDFSGVGASDYVATFYDELGASAGDALIANDLVWTINPCPIGSVWVNKLPPALSGCFIITDPLGRVFGPIETITFEPVSPTSEYRVADLCEVTSDAAGEVVTITGIGVQGPCAGDANGDRVVDLTDLAEVLAGFGQTGVGLAGDVDYDGDVDLTDLAIVLANFGVAC